jgi:hypothetical protein
MENLQVQEVIYQQLQKLRAPFPEHQISQLPKPTKAQTDAVKADYTKGIRCEICGAWHHPKVVHLSYVGHAALTDRLLDVDPAWVWEPLSLDEKGLPALDKDGGLWIRLTVCGVTRLGYGDAQGKTGGDAMKERIGDALRNAAMRFGAALDLWHKGVLHLEEEPEEPAPAPAPRKQSAKQAAQTQQDAPQGPETDAAVIATHVSAMDACRTLETLKATFAEAWKATRGAPSVKRAYDTHKAVLENPAPEAA